MNMRKRQPSPWTFEFDKMDVDVAGIQIQTAELAQELSVHRHRQGQLAMVLRGALSCTVPGALWVAPANSGLWVPGGMPHSVSLTANGNVCFLFVDAKSAAPLPDACRTLAIGPLLRELIIHMAQMPKARNHSPETIRLRAVLLDQLKSAAAQSIYLPVSDDPRLRRLTDWMMKNPADRSTAAQWASRLAMSSRSLSRLLQAELGMSFSPWRQRLHVVIAMKALAAGRPVQNVAADLGYQSVGAFIIMFKKATGMLPGRYLMHNKAERRMAWTRQAPDVKALER